MPEYVLGHHLKGEGKWLALMSELLDPMHRRHIEALDLVKPGSRASRGKGWQAEISEA